MDQKNDSEDDCFIPAKWEEQTMHGCAFNLNALSLSVNKMLSCPKQLHSGSRPQTFATRTCFPEVKLSSLHRQVDEGFCVFRQSGQEKNQEGIDIKYWKNEKDSIDQFLARQELVYDKMADYQQKLFPQHERTSRFKVISHLRDYHSNSIAELRDAPTASTLNNSFADQFESRFECGNLGQAYRSFGRRQYYLLLENDVNSHGYTSWFFFRIKSSQKGIIQFHILNMAKEPYLHTIGMQICIFSTRRKSTEGLGWHYGGSNIKTQTTNFCKRNKCCENYYCLSFQYEVLAENDEVYFSLNQPYTYSRIIRELQKFQQKVHNTNAQQEKITIRIIKKVYSICHNIIPIIQIYKNHTNQLKQCLVFMARQHPAEVVSSFVMDRLIHLFITKNSQTQNLLDKFKIVIIPMANPDGVIHGNSRCNISGLDLNRNWQEELLRELTPETFGLRKYLWKLKKSPGIHMLIDLHGHSKKMNSFFFCSRPEIGSLGYLFPFLASKIESIFDFSSCTFNTTPDKLNTLRCQLSQSGMPNCYTLQNSYFGYWKDKTHKPFEEEDYLKIASGVVEAINLVSSSSQKQISELLLQKYKIKNFSEEFSKCKETLRRAQLQKISTIMKQNSESDSDPQGDLLTPDEMDNIYMRSNQKNQNQFALQLKTRERKKKDAKNLTEKSTELRKSHPPISPENEEKKTRAHGSEKKIILSQHRGKLSKTQTRLKPKIQKVKKQNELMEKTVNTKNLVVLQEQLEEVQLKKNNSNILYKPMNFEAMLIKNNRAKKMKQKLEAQMVCCLNIPKETSLSHKKVQKQRNFLRDTLSIANFKKQPETCTLDHSKRSKTESSQIITFKTISPAKLMKKTKSKITHQNYHRQMIKRKQKLNKKEEKETQNQMIDHQLKRREVSVQATTSVFYHFPIL